VKQLKSVVMDELNVERTLMRMAYEMLERNRGADNLMLVGVKRRGMPLARMMADNMQHIEGVRVRVEEIDTMRYRDDLSEHQHTPDNGGNSSIGDITGWRCILVDDVLYTGRTARAAMDALMALGRPKLIRLAALIDRGHRELPVHADFIGRHVPTGRTELIAVRVPEYDACLDVLLYETDPDKFVAQNHVII